MSKAICSFNIDREILEHLKKRAKDEGRSVSNLVNNILWKEMQQNERTYHLGKEQTIEV